jgi:hypothetical protein
MDPDTDEFSLVERNVQGAPAAHRQSYDEKETNQTAATEIFLKRATFLKRSPRQVLSRGAEEALPSQKVTAPCMSSPHDLQ